MPRATEEIARYETRIIDDLVRWNATTRLCKIDVATSVIKVGFAGGVPDGADRKVKQLLPEELRYLEIEFETNVGNPCP